MLATKVAQSLTAIDSPCTQSGFTADSLTIQNLQFY
jgi:hypothetical protein